MRVVFMGTPAFAAASLSALFAAGFGIPGVFTQPDKPRDRGMKASASPVKELAEARGVPVFQPEKLRDGTALACLRELRPDVLAVVAYGRILPDEILAVPPLGCVNVHGSLLPKYRGAAPIQRAVLAGERFTGVTTMYLAHDMDAGDIIYQEQTEIGEFETSGALFDRLAGLGAALLVRTLRNIEAGTAPRTPQDAGAATFAPPLDRSLSPIDWNTSPRAVVKHICGLSPWPGATARVGDAEVRVWAAEYTGEHTGKAPGSIVSAGKGGIEFACAGGETLRVTELQAPGGRRMAAADWLRGHPVKP